MLIDWLRKMASRRARRRARAIVAQADHARDDRRFADAAALYADALRLDPTLSHIEVQCGHMLKESGDLAGAEQRYRIAAQLRPQDADLVLQFGHLFKASGRLAEAEAAYARAIAMSPGWDAPARELAHLRDAGWHGTGVAPVHAPPPDDVAPPSSRALAPALAPQSAEALERRYTDHIAFRQLGRRGPNGWTGAPTLRGVEAIRAVCVSATPIVEVELRLGDLTLYRGPVGPGHPLPHDGERSHRKYSCNIWYDFSPHRTGRYNLELGFRDADHLLRFIRRDVDVAEPWAEADHPASDALVSLDPTDTRTIEQQIDARRSMVRPAARRLFASPPRAILVQRTDQLGDLIASVPAVRRLRALFGTARIVGMLTAANADMAATLDLFDEIIVIDFPDDPVERRRLMPLEDQERLRARLAAYGFDIAIDLSQSDVSRPLLRLSGAPFLLGVGDGSWPWLSAGFDFNTHDPLTRLDIVPHSTKVLAMIEAFAAVLESSAPVIPATPAPARLAALGLDPGQPYVVLHGGARIAFSRWPHFPALARIILAETDCAVVLLSEDPDLRATLPADILGSSRFLLFDRRLPFDDLDALVASCTAMVANDSGPKHLGGLRGVPVVTLFSSRIDWREWAQETTGLVISRKVPCAGCAIFHDADECAKGFTCVTAIRPREVFEALRAYLPPG